MPVMDGAGDASDVRPSKTSPSFLHANSTSHTWVFSAFAELIDNAYDPDVAATELTIDKKIIKTIPVLAFLDNGKGMVPEKLYKMLSLGYCEKVEIKGHKPIGHYGNGFKSGSMRLGHDAMVFTRSNGTMSIGFLSQSYLEKIKADTVLVPIVTWDAKTKDIIESVDSSGSLKALTTYSLFSTEQELLEQFTPFSKGTLILIYNLKRGSAGRLEIDFESNPRDILNSAHQELDFATEVRPVSEYMPEYRRSLREYCSILFLRPRMKIVLRGEKVKTKLVSKSLSKTEKDVYKPTWLEKPVRITFGFGMSQEDYGILMYHRNRLIKAYEKVGYQRHQANVQAIGVVGIVQCDFLEPIHNKQDFSKTDRYNSFINAIGQKMNDYWNEKKQFPLGATRESGQKVQLPDWTWAQCDNCLKWRRLPGIVDSETLPNKWFCYMNSDPTHNRCDISEEPEDEDELMMQVTYKKTYKRQQEQERRKKADEQKKVMERLEQSRREEKARYQQQLEDARRREEQQKQIIAQLSQQKAEIAMQQLKLRQKMAADAHWLQSQREQSPGTNNARCSTPLGTRRRADDGVDSDSTPKRQRIQTQTLNGNRTTPNTTLEVGITSNGHRNAPVQVDTDDDDDDDDVIIICSQDDDCHAAVDSSVKVKLETVKTEKTDSPKMAAGASSATIPEEVGTKDKQSSTQSATVTSGNVSVTSVPAPATSTLVPVKSNPTDESGANEKDERVAELKQQLKESEDRYMSLQRNVRSLLQIIVPDLKVPALSFVNDIVVEMIKVNSRQAGGDGSGDNSGQ